MEHASVGHGRMDHGDHSRHNMAMTVVNSAMKAIMKALQAKLAIDHPCHVCMHDVDAAHHHARMDMGGDGDINMDRGISMSFHMGYKEVILFDWWSIDSVWSLIGSVVGFYIFW